MFCYEFMRDRWSSEEPRRNKLMMNITALPALRNENKKLYKSIKSDGMGGIFS